MQSKCQFDLHAASGGQDLLKPAIKMSIVDSDDARDSIAISLMYSLGYTHKLMTWTSFQKDEYFISAYKPYRQLVVLDVTDAHGNIEVLRDGIQELLAKYGGEIDTLYADGLDVNTERPLNEQK